MLIGRSMLLLRRRADGAVILIAFLVNMAISNRSNFQGTKVCNKTIKQKSFLSANQV